MTTCLHTPSPVRSFEFVVVGAGPAGVAAARLLAERTGPERVALVGDEDHLPYERPALSKGALKGGIDAIPRICSPEEFDAVGLTYIGGHVASIDRTGRSLDTSAGPIGYGSLLLATGASSIRLNVPGAELPGIFYLRTAKEAEQLRIRLEGKPRVVVVGGGFIGLEVAATARSMGCEVVVITKGGHLMRRCMPSTIAATVTTLLQSDGIEFRLNAEPSAIEGVSSAASVRLASGELLPADIVVVGIGSAPNTSLASSAGLAVGDGILVNDRWMTSDPLIYAAGDAARRRLPGGSQEGVRLESWEPAIENGQLAAMAMLGDDVEEPGTPWMWSDQHEINIQIAGNPDPAGAMIIRPGQDGGAISAAFVDGSRITGAITVNDGRSMTLFRRAIAEARSINPVMLADPGTELKLALGMRRRT